MFNFRKGLFCLVLVSLALNAVFINPIFAQEFNATGYKILDPVIQPGGFSTTTSGDYQLNGVITQISVGTSTVTSTYNLSSGFLYFPAVTTPVVTATAGDASAALSWTAASGYLGWTVSGYNVGQSTVPGGPYTYVSLGNITSSTRTGLSNGTTYYFVIRPEDAFGNSLATSTEVSATPVAGAASAVVSTPTGSTGGGGPILDIFKKIFGKINRFISGSSRSDLNRDGRVDVLDISILFYWWNKPIQQPSFASVIVNVLNLGRPSPDINKDSAINLFDLSVLLSDWTN